MSRLHQVVGGGICAVLALGCSSAPERGVSEVKPSYAMLPNGNDPLNPDELSPLYVVASGGVEGNLTRIVEKAKGRPLNILTISGGGQNGAFGAGFLIGWRKRGDRPEFDAVAGVSTGALMATHVLLGTPEDDAILEELYTQISAKDVYKRRSLWSLVAGTDSLMDTAPLREMLVKYITPETLERVAAAADEQRFLVVGTTNIDYDQTWVWNMSAIAKSGDVQLYRDVLQASSAFPIVFPPVEIDGHLFVDGAARSNLVIPGLAGPTRPGPPLHGPGNIYLLDNGKIENPPEALRRSLGAVAATTVSVMMNQSMQTAMLRAYVGARSLGYDFHYVGIPTEVSIGNDPLAFEPEQMRAAFDAGLHAGQQENPWQTQPPPTNDLPRWAAELISDN